MLLHGICVCTLSVGQISIQRPRRVYSAHAGHCVSFYGRLSLSLNIKCCELGLGMEYIIVGIEGFSVSRERVGGRQVCI